MTDSISIDKTENILAQVFENQIKGNAEPHYLTELRSNSMEQFLSLGIPDSHNEEYKYSGLKKLFTKIESVNPSKKIKLADIDIAAYLPFSNAHVLVFVDGVFSSELSKLIPTENNLVVSPIGLAISAQNDPVKNFLGSRKSHPTDACFELNTAFFKEGTYIHIGPNTEVNVPVHILHIFTTQEPLLFNTRNLILIDKFSKADIFESFIGRTNPDKDEKAISNHVTEVFVQQGAALNYCCLQDLQQGVAQINHTNIYQHNGSVVRTHSFMLSGDFVRNNLQVVMADDNCESHLNGLYLPRKNEHVDNHTLVDHSKPHSYSNELYKGIMSDNSSAVFNGKIMVRKDAQKTNAFQSNKNILLGEGASVNTKPQLEIYADDVKCSHGTSTGRLDDEAIFYLRSRGIDKDNAKNLLMCAFAEEVVETLLNKELKAYFAKRIEARFESNS